MISIFISFLNLNRYYAFWICCLLHNYIQFIRQFFYCLSVFFFLKCVTFIALTIVFHVCLLCFYRIQKIYQIINKMTTMTLIINHVNTGLSMTPYTGPWNRSRASAPHVGHTDTQWKKMLKNPRTCIWDIVYSMQNF